MATGQPRLGSAWVFFGAGERAGAEHQEGEVGGEGVVLLIGRKRKEDQDEGGIERKQPVGAGAEFHLGNMACWIDEMGLLDVEIDRLSGIRTQVVEPLIAGLPGAPKGDRKKDAPRRQPD